MSEPPASSAQELLQQGRVPEAIAVLRSAARAGDVKAQFEAGRALLFAPGDAAAREAVQWLEQAERAGHAGAATWLAQIALGGVVVTRDFTQIGTRLYRASQAGEGAAMRAVALGLGRSSAPVAQREAARLLGQCAGTGDSVAALLLAARFRLGLGVPQDPAQAEAIEAQLLRSQLLPLPFVLPDAAGEPTEADADPRFSLTRMLAAPAPTRLSERPDVRHVRGLFNAEECRYLIAMARPRLHRSQVFRRDADRMADSDDRSSSEANFAPQHEDVALRLLQLRMARAAGCELVQAEPLIVLHYGGGDEYRPHRDYLPPSALAERQPQAGQRRTTICAYLSPVEKGGETEFPVAGLRVAPRQGDAVIFENLRPDGQPDPDSLHAGAPIEAGEKWLATLWLRQGRYRRF